MQNQPGHEAIAHTDQKHAAGNQGSDQRPPTRSGETTPDSVPERRASANADGNRSNSDDPQAPRRQEGRRGHKQRARLPEQVGGLVRLRLT